MTAINTYYEQRWSTENQYDRPPAATRVRMVGESIEKVLETRSTPIRILDVGCGNGWILAEIEKRFGNQVKLFGIEPSDCGAANASKRVPSANVVSGTLATVTYPEQFDLVVTSEVIEHVEDQRSFAREIAAVLKHDGVLVLTTPNGAFLEGYFEDNPEFTPQPIENWLTINELKNLFSEQFKARSIRTFTPDHFYNQHPVLSFARKTVQAIPGGRHIRCRIDRFVWSELQAGLNILAIFDRKSNG
jgi:2-polyprenyl-3-methyl-5-hydroxy-6-metoxy-1,4-benzoquinol methylase